MNGSRVRNTTSTPPLGSHPEARTHHQTSDGGRSKLGVTERYEDRKGGTLAKLSKNRTKVTTEVDTARKYTVEEACAIVKKAKFTKFDETVDIAEIGRESCRERV